MFCTIQCINCETSVYFLQMAEFQNKLSELEKCQSELVAENVSLKHCCLYLNEQRDQSLPARAAVCRDSGDGSSGSSSSVDKLVPTMHESDICSSLDDAQTKPQQLTKGIITSAKGDYAVSCVCLFVCSSLCQRYNSKSYG